MLNSLNNHFQEFLISHTLLLKIELFINNCNRKLNCIRKIFKWVLAKSQDIIKF
jgi:hypothetical protein